MNEKYTYYEVYFKGKGSSTWTKWQDYEQFLSARDAKDRILKLKQKAQVVRVDVVRRTVE